MMRPRPLLILACLSSFLFSGCAVHQLHNDQERMRSVLLELYTNQVMDNLVRAINGLPIIQLDYSNAQATVTADANFVVSDGLATSHTNTLTAVALQSTSVIRVLTNTLTATPGLSNINAVAVQANPVTTNNELYDAYLRYLAEPGSLRISDCPPPKGAAHRCVQFHKKYYWIPMEFRDEFFALATVTTAQRGLLLFPPEDFYRLSVIDLAEPTSVEHLICMLPEIEPWFKRPENFRALANDVLTKNNWLNKKQVARVGDNPMAMPLAEIIDQLVTNKPFKDTQLAELKAAKLGTANDILKYAAQAWPKDDPKAVQNAVQAGAEAVWRNHVAQDLLEHPTPIKNADQRRKDLENVTNDIAAYYASQKKNPEQAKDELKDKIVDIVGGMRKNGNFFVVPIKADKQVPNDVGYFEFEDGNTAVIAEYQPDCRGRRFISNELILFLDPNPDPAKAPPHMKTPGDLHFPITVKFFLNDPRKRPRERPTTKELLDRVPFPTPQVALEPPPVRAAPAPTELHRARFLAPQPIADAN
jgi:hypothetical protein